MPRAAKVWGQSWLFVFLFCFPSWLKPFWLKAQVSVSVFARCARGKGCPSLAVPTRFPFLMMGWQVVPSRRSGQKQAVDAASAVKAMEVLRACGLQFDSPPISLKASREQWRCGCGVQNWVDRRQCRRCTSSRFPGQEKGPKDQDGRTNNNKGNKDQNQSQGTSPPPLTEARQTFKPTPAPWAVAKEAEQRAQTLQQLLANVQSAGNLPELEKKLEDEIATLQRKVADKRPLSLKIQATEDYLERAAKRLTRAEEAVIQAQ